VDRKYTTSKSTTRKFRRNRKCNTSSKEEVAVELSRRNGTISSKQESRRSRFSKFNYRFAVTYAGGGGGGAKQPLVQEVQVEGVVHQQDHRSN
jgi:hypothetical protein